MPHSSLYGTYEVSRKYVHTVNIRHAFDTIEQHGPVHVLWKDGHPVDAPITQDARVLKVVPPEVARRGMPPGTVLEKRKAKCEICGAEFDTVKGRWCHICKLARQRKQQADWIEAKRRMQQAGVAK